VVLGRGPPAVEPGVRRAQGAMRGAARLQRRRRRVLLRQGIHAAGPRELEPRRHHRRLRAEYGAAVQ
jgi:hypothetical protein